MLKKTPLSERSTGEKCQHPMCKEALAIQEEAEEVNNEAAANAFIANMEEEAQLGNQDNHQPNVEVEPPAAPVEGYNAEEDNALRAF